MSYQNPIPSVDDEEVSKYFWIGFKFGEYLTTKEATDSINNYLQSHLPIDKSMIRMGHPYYMRMSESQPKKVYYCITGWDMYNDDLYIDNTLYCTRKSARIALEEHEKTNPKLRNLIISEVSVEDTIR